MSRCIYNILTNYLHFYILLVSKSFFKCCFLSKTVVKLWQIYIYGVQILNKDTIKHYAGLLAKVVLGAGLVAVFIANNLPEPYDRIKVEDTVALTHEVFGTPTPITDRESAVATTDNSSVINAEHPEATPAAEVSTQAGEENAASEPSAPEESAPVASDIPKTPETPEQPPAASTAAPQTTLDDASLININTASKAELMQLNGIGEVKAQAIIDYRENYGGFLTIDEITLVSGIGEKTLEKNRDRITV